MEEARVLNIDIDAFVLHNRVDERKRITQEANNELKKLKEEYQIKILNVILENKNDFITSVTGGKGVIEYKNRNNKTKKEMEKIFKEIKKINKRR